MILETKELKEILAHWKRLGKPTLVLLETIRDAQHAADVAWLEGWCPHQRTVIRRKCATCWAEFVSAGKGE